MNSYFEDYLITTHDVDTNNHLRPTVIAKLMQETGDHQMRDRKPTYYELFEQGKSFIVTRMSIEILEEVGMYEKVRVHTWRCPEKVATFIRCFAIEAEGRIVARSYSEWAVANRNTGKLCKASEVDISSYETDEPFEPNVPKRFRLPKDLEFEKVGTKTVRYSDVDMNMHMNNTNYQDMLWNFIPEIWNKELTSTNIRFMAEGSLGSEIEIYRAKAEEVMDDGLNPEETWYFYSMVNGKKNCEGIFNVKSLKK